MDKLVIANVFGAIGMVLIFITAIFKSKKLVLSIQSIGHFALGLSDIFASSYSALTQEALCMIRDIGIVTKKANLAFKIIILLLIAGLGIAVNIIVDNCNIFGFIAVGGNIIFTIDIFFNNKNAILFKFISGVNNILWMLLFIDYKVYTSAVANGASALINFGVALYIFILFRKGKMDKLGQKTIINEEEKNPNNNEFNQDNLLK